jgi:translation elongation factor EF-1beta
MNFELYEVWSVDEAGHEELLETTASRKEAEEIAEASLGLGYLQTVIYREDENGDLEEIQRFELG